MSTVHNLLPEFQGLGESSKVCLVDRQSVPSIEIHRANANDIREWLVHLSQ